MGPEYGGLSPAWRLLSKSAPTSFTSPPPNRHPMIRPTRAILPLSLLLLLPLFACSSKSPGAPTPPVLPPVNPLFLDVTQAAGLDYAHGYADPNFLDMTQTMTGGAACGDYDQDGWDDIYIARGDLGPNLLFRNMGDGSFQEVGKQAGVDLLQHSPSGPTFADLNGDGWPDLFLCGTHGSKPRLFTNQGNGSFLETTQSSGIQVMSDSFSAAFGDYDRDGDLDLFITQWGYEHSPDPKVSTRHLWQNNGSGVFSDVTISSQLGLSMVSDTANMRDNSFTPNWADIDNDGWLDLLIVSDYGHSRIFLNKQDGTFSLDTRTVLTDENGMGAAVADYDNDGDLDWFVSSIYDPNGFPEGWWGVSGNRLYQNQGDGSFADVTTVAGVRIGYWGWGSVFADFNNDGHLDIFHVNGFGLSGPPDPAGEFWQDPSPMFVSNGDGTFSERSLEFGVDDRGQGRGVVCFDYDHDGDEDLLITQNMQNLRLLRNDGGNSRNFLQVRLQGTATNRSAIGGRIYVTVGNQTQMRALSCGSNFISQNPAVAHFGLDQATLVDELRVVWPDGQETTLQNLPINQRLVINK